MPYRSYRERKDVYTKSLEQEVARARATETSLLNISQSLRDTVHALLHLLTKHGIEPPEDLWYQGEPNYKERVGRGSTSPVKWADKYNQTSSVTTPQSASTSNGTEQLNILSSISGSSYQTSPEPWPLKDPHENIRTPQQPQSTAQKKMAPSSARAPRGHTQRVCDTDPAVVGMEFVLAYVTALQVDETL